MKGLFQLLIFLIVFFLFFHFFIMNSDQSVSVTLWNGMRTPELPVGMLVIVSFLFGFLVGLLLFPLTYIIKRISS